MIEDYDISNHHNYAYHINITGADNSKGSFRLDWEYYFEGHPNYTVYNTYLPKKGP